MTRSVPSGRPTVVVTSEQALVAETVAAGLAGRGLAASTLEWSTDPRTGGCLPGPPSGPVGLLLSDLDNWTSLRMTWQLIAREPVAWVVVTAAPEGPMFTLAIPQSDPAADRKRSASRRSFVKMDDERPCGTALLSAIASSKSR